MKPGCTLIAYLHAKPEKREELLKLLQSFVEPSRLEPACVTIICTSAVTNRTYSSFIRLAHAQGAGRAPSDTHSYAFGLAGSTCRKRLGHQVYHHVERTSLNSIARLREVSAAPFSKSAGAFKDADGRVVHQITTLGNVLWPQS